MKVFNTEICCFFPAVTDVETTVDIAAVNEAASAQSVTVRMTDSHGEERDEDTEAQEEAAAAVVSLTSKDDIY